MTNKLFLLCLLTGLLCAYLEYYWIQQGYRSLAIVASKCPKPSMTTTRPSNTQGQSSTNQTSTESIVNWFWNFFANNRDKPVVPVVCETFEIHTDPRSTFILIKTLCLIGLTFKLISSLKNVPTLIRSRTLARQPSNLVTAMPKGDGILQQSKFFDTSNGKIGVVTTTIDKRTISVR